MQTIAIHAFQFFSRPTVEIGKEWTLRSSSASRPDLPVLLRFKTTEKPFPLVFADLRPHPPDVGAAEHVDPDVDGYFAKRWPTCISAEGHVALPQGFTDLFDDECHTLMYFVRRLLWELPGRTPSPQIPTDQRATLLGYRREFAHHQTYDIFGTRRTSPIPSFAPVDLGDPVGPGVVSFARPAIHGLNELVWSQALPYPTRTTIDADKEGIRRTLDALKRRYNADSELRDADRHRSHGETKAAVRSAASAVEACILFLVQSQCLQAPSSHLPFDQKIEFVLHAAGRQSFRTLEPAASLNLLHLYRARNSMHEGDCTFRRDDGVLVTLRTIEDAMPLLVSAELFVSWVESFA